MTGTHLLMESRSEAWPLDACDERQAYWQANADSLVFAAASVGIEHGLTSNQALWSYFRDFHRGGHVPAGDAS